MKIRTGPRRITPYYDPAVSRCRAVMVDDPSPLKVSASNAAWTCRGIGPVDVAKYTPEVYARLIPADDDGIVVVMSDVEPKVVNREEFNRELVQALDDLVSAARYHEAEIKASIARSDELSRRRRTEDAERARTTANGSAVRETPPVYRTDNLDERLERIERTLADIAQRMATKADLEKVRQEMATKADLEQVRQEMATKADLEQVRQEMATKADLEQVRKEMATKADLEQVRQEMATKITLESVQDDVRKVADGYATISQRLEYVANLLKPPAFR